MRKDGETCAAMVSYSFAHGKSVEYCSNGALMWGNNDIEAAITLADFEVIGIVDDSNPYPALLGINLAIDMNGVINLKK